MKEKILNFAPYYDKTLPLNIRLMGETEYEERIDVVRTKSELMSLEFISDGWGTLEINGQTYHPQKNDVFFLKKGSNHHYYSSKENPWHKYWVIFEGPLADMLVKNYLPENTYFFPDCHCKNIVQNIIKIADTYADDYKRMVDEISVELMRFFVYVSHRDERRRDDLSEKIRKKIDFYIEKEFSLDTVCEDLGYSKNYIIQVFEKAYGVTPYQYYMEKKFAAAKNYLEDTTLPIGEIAERLSYCDQRYFSVCFKNYVGMSPTEYRKKMQNA